MFESCVMHWPFVCPADVVRVIVRLATLTFVAIHIRGRSVGEQKVPEVLTYMRNSIYISPEK